MADRTYRGDRERYDRGRGYGRQAEQFDTTEHGWRTDERGYGQMGEGWRDEDYGQFDTSGPSYARDRDVARDWGREPAPRRSGYHSGFGGGSYGASRFEPGRGFGSFTGNDFGGRDFSTPQYTGTRSPLGYGAGSQLAANHGEWHDYGATPSREHRDYRGTWGERTGKGNWLDRASETVAGWFSDDDDERRYRERGYRGRGPANYTRSDERIREDACDALTEDWSVDASGIQVTVQNGEVTLDGTVPSREQKRRAEDCVDDLSGVRNVQNNLRVDESAWDRDTGTASRSNTTSSQT